MKNIYFCVAFNMSSANAFNLDQSKILSFSKEFNPFPNDKFYTPPNWKFADDKLILNENGRKLSKRIENTAGKGEIARYEQFLLFPQCFQKYLKQTRKNQGLFGKGLSGLKTHFCSYKGKKSNPLLVTSNFFFSHSVFKSILKQTRKNQGLFGKGLSGLKTHFCSYKGKKSNPLRSIACWY